MNKSDTIGKLATALVKAQACMKNASKGSINPHFKSRYADLPSVLEVVRSPLNENGLSLTGGISIGDNNVVEVEVMLLHESGEWLSATAKAVTKDTTPQAIGSATTYLRRYLTQTVCGIGSEDDDGETAQPRQGGAVHSATPKTMNEVRQAVVDPGQTHGKAIAALIAKGTTTEQAETIIAQVLKAAGKSSISEVNNADAFIAALLKKIPAKAPLVESPASFAKYVASKSRPSHLSPEDAARAVLAYLEANATNLDDLDEAGRKLLAEQLIEFHLPDIYPPAKTAKAAKKAPSNPVDYDPIVEQDVVGRSGRDETYD